MHIRTLRSLALVALVVTACTQDSPSSPPARAAAVPVGADVPIDGAWNWMETTDIRLRPAAVALFGIAPEGPITRLRCESGGTLTINQNGTTFDGSAIQGSSCTTAGGVTFVPPAFPPGWALVNGHLEGRSVRFTADTGVFPCHYRGSVRVEGGQAVALKAAGSCEVPPELGTDRIFFEATRP